MTDITARKGGRHLVPRAERQRLVNAVVTLDGNPAVVCGVANDYATVAALDGSASFDWSWPTARHIVDDRDGRFTS